MISSIRGALSGTGHGYLVVELGGVGLRVEVPTATAAAHHSGEEVSLHTSLIVREDSLTLYGFETVDELEVFSKLLTVSGVGPRSALGVLSELSPSQVVAAVMADDEKPFRRVSGVGPKTAKLIMVSLSGKLDHLQHVGENEESQASLGAGGAQVIVGLTGLGWPEQAAADAVGDALAAGAEADDSAALMRSALALLQAPRAKGKTR